jgi:hypothetical protein
MSRSAIWKWGSIAAIFTLLAASVAVFHSFAAAAGGPTTAQKTGRTILTGERIPALKGAKSVGVAYPSTSTMSFSVNLQLHNKAGLAKLLQEQNDRSSPLYHHYLTPDQFTAQFGPTASDVAAVTNFLRSEHLVVDAVAPNHLIIDAHGSSAHVEHAFGTNLGYFTFHGRRVFAPTGDISVPSALAGIVMHVAGLDDVAQYHPLLTQHVQLSPRLSPHPGPGGGYTPSELRTAYDMNSLISSDSGTGQTVGIFELDGYVPSDINTYLSNYGLGSAKYSNVLVDGATNTAGAGAIEVELDMEVISAIAPGATQHIYIGPNSTTGVNDTYNKIVTDDTAKVSSTSWGECESASGTSELASLDTIFTQAAAQGQAIFAAAGDSGAYDCDDTNLAVDSPADDPHVVGVGGTTLTTGSGGSYSSETVWSCSSCSGRGPNGTGGGGGLSTYFTQPSYQSGPGVSNSYSNGNREVPDVSADADPNSGYSIYCSVAAAGCSSGSAAWTVVGGTSAAAPLWAGSITDANQYLAGLSKPTFGGASSTLYSLFNTSQTYAAYHDITTGNNLYYPATSGYDLASGIGTPDLWNLARDAAGGSGGTNDFSIAASPTSISIAQGNNGTATISTAVTSGSAGTVSLSASVSPSGPTAALSPTSVTAGNSSTLTITVGSSVSTGSYTVTVTGTEGTKTHTATVAVTVTSSGGGGGGITNGGFETGNLSGWTASGAATGVSTTAHSGSYSAQLGLSTPTNGDSTISQTFTVPSGDGTLSFWYKVVCPDTVTYDWATASLKDNTSNTTSTLLPKTCNNSNTWVQVTTSVTAGHSLTLTLTSHDDNYYADPTYTLYDDVALSAAVSNPIVNGGFETGSLSGWTASGAATGVSTTAHSGSYSAQLGLSTPTNGDSSIAQTFTAPSGTSTLSFWYNVNCPDTVTYDWATATLKDNTANTTKTVLAKTCNNNATWVQVTTSVTAGHSYTLTLTSHDDNYYADPTYTLYDDVKVS